MTSKANAIKALNAIKYFEESWYSDLFPIIEKQLNQPTLDDCIAVVEEYAERYNDLHDAVLLTEVLLALKGLKEGK